MYIILKGSVGIFITSVIGTLTQVATIKVGDFFGEMAIFDNLPRSASCIALEDTMAVDQDEFPDKASKAAIALSLANLLVYCGERKDLKNYIAIATESPDDRIRNRALQIMAKLERMQNK